MNILIKRVWTIFIMSGCVFLEAQVPQLTRCLNVAIRLTPKKQAKLVSAGIGWVDLAFFSEKSNYRIEVTGVSGRIYSAYCNLGSQMISEPPVKIQESQSQDERERLITQLPVFPAGKTVGPRPGRTNSVDGSIDSGASHLISAIIPCEEDGVGYRIKNIRSGELVGEEWFKSQRKPTITMETDGPSKWHARTGGLSATISLHYSFDEGKSWIPGEVVLDQSEILVESSQMRWHQNKQQTHDRSKMVSADTPVIAEMQVMVGLRLYRQRYKFNEKASILPMEGVAEIKYEK